MSEDSGEEKSHEPSQRRLDEARKRGETPTSTDLFGAGSVAGILVAALIFGPNALSHTGLAAQGLLDRADALAPQIMAAPGAQLTGIGISLLWPIAPFFILPVVFVILVAIAQRATVFAPDRIIPKLSKISLLSNARQKFGREGMFQFGKSAVKLAAISILLVSYTLGQGENITNSLRMSPAQSSVIMMQMMREFLMLALGFTVLAGGVDYAWQIFQHLSRNRMSRKEVVDEMKESEGDPHVKMQRRMRGQEIATNQMLADVERADVVIVNPTHYAVALKWKRGDKSAPVCVAKGADEIATRIRERAATHGVPLHSDPPTARAIFATVDIGAQIQPGQFKAVAAAIRFAETMRKKAKGWQR
jgi:flagellar biosynthetic protein FlhB